MTSASSARISTADSLRRRLRSRLQARGGLRHAAVVERDDGGHVLQPLVCSTDGRFIPSAELTRDQLKILHNAAGLDAGDYPVRVADGLYFSEVVAESNPDASDYVDLISRSVSVLAEAGRGGPMSLSDLVACGQRIQHLDAAFANARVGRPLDALHRCVGPDPSHPYAKLTVCRTSFPVTVADQRIDFFFEKFLVVYAYLSADGVRCSTDTPIHSHPLNFETVYFRGFGPGSRVVEQEFRLLNAEGIPLIDAGGQVNELFFKGDSTGSVRVEPGTTAEIAAETEAIMLPPFDMELALRERPGLVRATDGLFRPHRVTVRDDPEVKTAYFAIDNYFGPAGRVLLYGGDGTSVWTHDDWVKPRR